MYLTKSGYMIDKKEMSQEMLWKMKEELVGVPIQDEKFKNAGSKFLVYKETSTQLILPVNYAVSKFGIPKMTKEFQGTRIDETRTLFKGELQETQLEPYNKLLDRVKQPIPTGGTLCLFTGGGKTFIAIKLITETKRTTLIIVNKISLLNQWKNEIEKFAPNLRVGVLQAKNVDIVDKDVVICMLQTLVKGYDKMFDDISMVILDEAHNVSSKVFSTIMFKIASPVMIGLSATPQRADGLDYVLRWHIGDMIYKSEKNKMDREPEIRIIEVNSSEYKEVSVVNSYTRQVQLQFTTMLSDLVLMKKRNRLIVEVTKSLFPHVERKVLLLTERRTHANVLFKMFQQEDVNFTYALFLGGMKIETLNQARQANVIIATIAAFSEGVSEKDLNTLILTTPKKFVGHLKKTVKQESGKMEQIVGRIFRKTHETIKPLIIDLADNFSVYKQHAKQRQVFYKNHFNNVMMSHQSIDLDQYSETELTIDCIKTKQTRKKIDVKYCLLD